MAASDYSAPLTRKCRSSPSLQSIIDLPECDFYPDPKGRKSSCDRSAVDRRLLFSFESYCAPEFPSGGSAKRALELTYSVSDPNLNFDLITQPFSLFRSSDSRKV